MALTYVGGNVASKVGATSGNSTISLTTLTGGSGSAAQTGDLVIAIYATGSTADRTLSITDGTNAYTLVEELYSNIAGYDTNLRVAYKRLTAADTSVTFGPTGNTADAGAMAVHVWRGINTAQILDVTSTTATGSGGVLATPPAITPVTSGAIVICAAGAATGVGAVYTASQLSNFRSATGADTNDAIVGVGSFAWTSGQFTPTQWSNSATSTGTATWAAVTMALRPAFDQTLTPSLFTNTNTFHSPTVTAVVPAQSLTQAARLTNANAFYDVTIAIGAVNLAPIKVINANTFYSSTVSVGTVNLSAARFDNQNTFYTHDVIEGAFDLHQIARFDNSSAFYSPSVAAGTVTLSPSIYTNTNIFYSLDIIEGGNDLHQIARFNNANTFYPLDVEEGQYDLHQNSRLNNSNTFYSAVVSQPGVQPTQLAGFVKKRPFRPARIIAAEDLWTDGRIVVDSITASIKAGDVQAIGEIIIPATARILPIDIVARSHEITAFSSWNDPTDDELLAIIEYLV